MKIAYFVLLHQKFSQFCWLFDAIYTEEDVFLVHVDRKSSNELYDKVRSHVRTLPNVSFLPRRSVTHGSWSLVDVELQAMRVLLESDTTWQYLINVSAQDYPIKPISFIRTRLQAAWPRNFIEVFPLAEIAERDPLDPHLERFLVFDVFGRLVRTPIRLPFPTSIDIKYKGAAWHMLTRDFCQWLLGNPMTKRIERLVKHTWAPDELFFQALIMHSPFRDLRKDYGREIIWSREHFGGPKMARPEKPVRRPRRPPNRQSCNPKTLRMEDYDRLSASEALFARKFDSSVDRQLMVHLARDHGYRVPQVCEPG